MPQHERGLNPRPVVVGLVKAKDMHCLVATVVATVVVDDF